MGDRHHRAASAAHKFHASIKLLGECRDDDRTYGDERMVERIG
jgi:hypothetical protein